MNPLHARVKRAVDARLEEVLGRDGDDGRVLEKVRAADIGLFAAGYVVLFLFFLRFFFLAGLGRVGGPPGLLDVLSGGVGMRFIRFGRGYVSLGWMMDRWMATGAGRKWAGWGGVVCGPRLVSLLGMGFCGGSSFWLTL